MEYQGLGNVTNVRCRQCGEGFPVFTFSSDTDMPIHGLASLTRTDTKDLAIARTLPGESMQALQDRVGGTYRVSVPSIVQHPGPCGVSFRQFRESYRPPTITYLL